MASTQLMLAAFLVREPRSLYPGFLKAHEQAVALGGLTTELRLDGAYGLYVFEGNLAKAESELLEARRQKPRSPEAYARLAMIYLAQGLLEEARAEMQRARAADLLQPPLAFVETIVRLYRREYGPAIEHGQESLELHPASPFGRVHYAEALEHSGRRDEAAAEYRNASALAPDAPWIRAQEARFLAKIGRSAEAQEILKELERTRETEYVDAYHLALLLDALGKRDEAFRELDRAYEECSHMMLLMEQDAKADPLRGDRRYARVREKVLRRARHSPAAGSALSHASRSAASD
jgi:tetratricopeptide (TPR) repeat protein